MPAGRDLNAIITYACRATGRRAYSCGVLSGRQSCRTRLDRSPEDVEHGAPARPAAMRGREPSGFKSDRLNSLRPREASTSLEHRTPIKWCIPRSGSAAYLTSRHDDALSLAIIPSANWDPPAMHHAKVAGPTKRMVEEHPSLPSCAHAAGACGGQCVRQYSRASAGLHGRIESRSGGSRLTSWARRSSRSLKQKPRTSHIVAAWLFRFRQHIAQLSS